MMTRQSTGYFQQVPVILLLCFISSFAFAGSALALTGNNIDACYDCHGSPNDIRPIDSTFRDTFNGAFVGNHRTHLSTATTIANACVTCHGPAPTVMDHRDGQIHLNNGSIKNGTYSKAAFFNQTSRPVMGSCTGVNCHFNTVTPDWGTTPTWAANKSANDGNLKCAACHSATTLASGTHSKHITAGGNTQAACKSCHPDNNALAGTDAFQHATSAARPINVNFSAAPNLGGTYVGGRTTTADFLPPTAVAATGTCSALYCHSPGTKAIAPFAGGNQTATWGGSLTCKGCHKSDAASLDTMATGSHGRHVNGAAGIIIVSCVRCHAATVNAGMAIKDVAKHVNATVDIAFDSTSTAVGGKYKGAVAPTGVVPGTLPYGQCENVYCHSNGQNNGGTGITYKTPTWGNSGSGNCGTCHDINNIMHAGASASQISTGSHTKHLSYNSIATSDLYRCAQCHNLSNEAYPINPKFGVSAGGGCTDACHSIKHVNHQIEVMIPTELGTTPLYDGSPNPGSGYSTCSNVYCHGDGQTPPGYAPTALWGSGPISCTACHGSATVNSPAGTALSGKHAAHVNPAVNTELGTGNGFGCVECHQLTVANNTTLNAATGTTVHVNKFIDYTGLRAGGPLRYNSATKQCSNFYCHSNGKVGTDIGQFANPAVWNSVTASQKCNYCHGRQVTRKDPDANFARYSSTGVPNYMSGFTQGSYSANSHRQHMAQMATTDYSNTQVCYSCHSATLDSTTGRAATAAKFRAFSSRHVSGAYNIKFKASIGGTYTGGVGNKNCSASLCHGGTSPKWGANTTNDGCTKCHGTPSATVTATTKYLVAPPVNTSQLTGTLTGTGQVSNNPKVGAHQTHIRFTNGFSNYSTQTFRCESCHGTLPTSTNHITGSSVPAFQGMATKRGAMTPVWTPASLSCSNTYCHNPAGAGGSLNGANVGLRTFVSWTSSAYLSNTAKIQSNCNRCHKSPGDAGFTSSGYNHGAMVISDDCAGCHGHNGNASGISGQRHLDGVKYGGGDCDACHGYDTVGATYAAPTWTGGTWGVLPYRDGLSPSEGWGAHAKHINHIKTNLGISVALDPTNQTYGLGDPRRVCGTCHTNLEANHIMGGSPTRTINFGDNVYKSGYDGAAAGFDFRFGPSNPFYSGVSGTSSSVNPKNCLNTSCHTGTAPVWSTY